MSSLKRIKAMKMNKQCLPCLVNQVVKMASMTGCLNQEIAAASKVNAAASVITAYNTKKRK